MVFKQLIGYLWYVNSIDKADTRRGTHLQYFNAHTHQSLHQPLPQVMSGAAAGAVSAVHSPLNAATGAICQVGWAIISALTVQ